MGDNDRPRLKQALGALILEVAEVVDFDELEGWTVIDSAEGIDDLWVMEGAAESLVNASKQVLAQVRQRMGADVDELGPVRLGDMLYRSGEKFDRTIIEGQGMPLMEWLGDDLKDAINPNSVLISAVRAIATKREQDPKVVEQTFYLYKRAEDGAFVLTRIPEDRAPKYFAKMKHGERR